MAAGAPKEGVGVGERFFEHVSRVWLLGLVPAGATPNQVTLVGFGFGALAGLSLVLARWSDWFFLLGALSMVLFQLCDSLDGAVARARKMGSPRGYYLDQMVDVVSTILIFVGLGFSGHARIEIMIWPALLYVVHLVVILHWINLKDRWPFPTFGPVELYLTLACLMVAMFFHGGAIATFHGVGLTIVDCVTLAVLPFSVIDCFRVGYALFRELDPPGLGG